MLVLDIRQLESPTRLRPLVLSILIGGLVYGAVMGAFGGVWGEPLLQVVYSALKVPLLLGVTFIVTLPSFFVINTLVGLRDDFAQVLRALIGTQAVLAIILASLAPYTALWYASSDSYLWAQLFNLFMFALASIAAQVSLRRMYRPLIAKNRRHRSMLLAWLVVYAFVGVQMAWVLRPFVGNPGQPTQFFREDAWSNAYEVVFRLFSRALAGG